MLSKSELSDNLKRSADNMRRAREIAKTRNIKAGLPESDNINRQQSDLPVSPGVNSQA